MGKEETYVYCVLIVYIKGIRVLFGFDKYFDKVVDF